MLRVLKRPLSEHPGIVTVPMHKGATLLSSQVQYGTPTLWTSEDDSQELVDHFFVLIQTGEAVPDLRTHRYLATFLMENGSFVMHLYCQD